MIQIDTCAIKKARADIEYKSEPASEEAWTHYESLVAQGKVKEKT